MEQSRDILSIICKQRFLYLSLQVYTRPGVQQYVKLSNLNWTPLQHYNYVPPLRPSKSYGVVMVAKPAVELAQPAVNLAQPAVGLAQLAMYLAQPPTGGPAIYRGIKN